MSPSEVSVSTNERRHHPPRKRADFPTRSLVTREFEELLERGKQMTAVATLAGALLSEPIDWKGINWKKVNRNVKQLQVRIVKLQQIEFSCCSASCQRAL